MSPCLFFVGMKAMKIRKKKGAFNNLAYFDSCSLVLSLVRAHFRKMVILAVYDRTTVKMPLRAAARSEHIGKVMEVFRDHTELMFRLSVHVNQFLIVYMTRFPGSVPTETLVVYLARAILGMGWGNTYGPDSPRHLEQTRVRDCFNEIYRGTMSERDHAYFEGDRQMYIHPSLSYMARQTLKDLKHSVICNYNALVGCAAKAIVKRNLLAKAINAADSTLAEKVALFEALDLQVSRVEYDLRLPHRQMLCDNEYQELVTTARGHLPAQGERPVLYYIKSNPLAYVTYSMHLHDILRVRHYAGKKAPSLFPLHTDQVWGHTLVDTKTFINKMVNEDNTAAIYDYLREQGYQLHESYTTPTKSHLVWNIAWYQHGVWSFFFKLHMIEKNSHKFSGSVYTDGVSISLHREPNEGMGVQGEVQGEEGGAAGAVTRPDREFQYINDLSPEEKDKLKEKALLGLDPNYGDLLSVVSGPTKYHRRHRHTNNHRRKDLGIKNARKKRKQGKTVQRYGANGNQSINELEAGLSGFNKNSLQLDEFVAYCAAKNAYNSAVRPFYGKYMFRKLRFDAHLRRQRSEDMVLKRFKAALHPNRPASEVVIGWGDFSQFNALRFHEPTKGIGFRRLFRKAGYHVYLVDEYLTSQKCCKCAMGGPGVGLCKTFKRVKNPRPYRVFETPTVKCHGLVKCGQCNTMYNRDVNSAVNIWRIAHAAIMGLHRPLYMAR